MTVTSTVSRASYVAVGGETSVAVPFGVQRTGDLKVYKAPSGGTVSLLTYGTHYTIATSQLGATTSVISLVTAAAAGDVFYLRRVLPVVQDLDLRNQGAYAPATLETGGLDRIFQILQQIDALTSTADLSLARALILGDDDVIGSGAYNALSNRIENLDNGTAAQDAVTLSQMQAAVAGVVGGGSGSTRVIVTAATLPVADVLYDFAATGIEYIVRDTGFPDVIKRCLRLSTGNTYDWFVVVQGDV